MNFDQRKAEAAKMVSAFLMDFSTPRGMSVDQQSSRISGVADAFARRMPTKGDFSESCQAVLDKVRDTHMSNSWPAQAVFVIAMPQSEAMTPKAAETYRIDEWELAAKRMAAGEPVAEQYVWGAASDGLVSKGLVTPESRDRYRIGAVAAATGAWSGDAQKIMVSKFGHVVSSYFEQVTGRQSG